MVLGTKDQYNRALEKARKLGTVRTIRKIRDGQFLVPSGTPNVNYVVGVIGSEIECSCQAGRRGIPCYHGAGVRQALWGEQMGAVIPKVGRLDGQEVRL